MLSLISTRSLALSSGMSTVLMPPRKAASSFSLRPTIGHTRPRFDFAGHGEVAAHRNAGHHRDDRGGHGDAGGGSVLRGRAFRHVHVDVALVKQGRLNTEGDRAHAHVRRRRRDRFLHHVAQVAGHRHPALARHHGGFDGEQLAADIGPTTECGWAGKKYGPPQQYPRPKGRYDTLCPFSRPHPPKKP